MTKIASSRRRVMIASFFVIATMFLAIATTPFGSSGFPGAEATTGGWSQQQRAPGSTTTSPSIAGAGGSLYMAWKGAGDDQGIWWSVYDGSTWSDQQRAPGSTTTSPSIARGGEVLYMAWKGAGDDQGIWWSTNAVGTWSAQQRAPGSTSTSPSLANLGGGLFRLYMAWKGVSDDQGIWLSAISHNRIWSAQERAPGSTSTSPSIAEHNGRLYMAWKGAGDDQGIWWSVLEGNRWSDQQRAPGSTTTSPSIASAGGSLYMAWKGAGDDQGIWWSELEVGEPVGVANLQMNCIHDAIWPARGASVTITAKAFDGNLAPRTVDSIEIWVNSESAPSLTGSGINNLPYTFNAPSGPISNSFSYRCRVIDDGQIISTGWRTVSLTGTPLQGRAAPVLITDPARNALDIVFIPHGTSYTGPTPFTQPQFLNDVRMAIEAYYHEPIFLNIQNRINFWIAQDTAGGTGYNPAPTGNQCILTPPTNWPVGYTFANTGAIVHRDVPPNQVIPRDCARWGINIFSADADILSGAPAPGFPRIFLHETGHQPFGLVDEYCCDGGYTPPSTDGPRNLFSTLAACQNDPLVQEIGGACRQLTGTNPITGAPMTLSWWTSDPIADHLMDRGNGRAQPLDVRRINWWFDNCEPQGC